MHHAYSHRNRINTGVVFGTLAYSGVCVSGIGAAFITSIFAITSFGAFVYVLINRSQKSFGLILLSLIPVIGALIALERLFQKAWKQVFGGIFFYLYPLVFLQASDSQRIIGALIGGTLFYLFFMLVPGVRMRPGNSFVFMWALPTIFFFIVAALFLPFIGQGADVDPGDFDSDSESDLGEFEQMDYSIASFSNSGDALSDLSQQTNYEQFDVLSYPDQRAPEPIWSESHFDNETGRFSVSSSSGDFEFTSPHEGQLIGHNSDGQMIRISQNPQTGHIEMSGPDGIKFFTQDQATGNWSTTDASGTTVIKTDPITGWTHVNGPNSEMTIKVNPFTNTAFGSGTSTAD